MTAPSDGSEFVSQPGPENAEPPQSLIGRVQQLLSESVSANLVLLAIVLVGLPFSVWLDLRHLSDNALRTQVDSLAVVVGNFRNYYSDNIVDRVLANPHGSAVIANYQDVPGAIPIPATLSLELGSALGKADAAFHFRYRYFSQYPFPTRSPHRFDQFERDALAALERKQETRVYQISGSIFQRDIRLATPIVMEAACVSCHNADPTSPKRDWKIGDVGGIEEFAVSLPLAANVFAFKYLLLYFLIVAAACLIWLSLQRHQAAVISRMNTELGRANQFLAGIAQKLAKYLSPQHYRSIFSGQKDVALSTERKKLTIFFSDIVEFTATTERMQPEELTSLLNEYLTEMSQVAIEHGGSVNKFIGDAMLVFFGDHDSRGVEEDARACLRMAFDMQRRLAQLNVKWRRQGIEKPFRCRMGVNTGYCNVGNFGSDERMDYTIIGAEANLAARLQSIAQPNGIVISYETFMLVTDMVRAHALEPITLKGVGRTIIPYSVECPETEGDALNQSVITEHAPGLDLFLDVRAVNSASAERIAKTLEAALNAVKTAAASTTPG